VDLEGAVPAQVVNDAIRSNDPNIIEQWMVRNRDSLEEIDRHYGNTDYGDNHGNERNEFETVEDGEDVEAQFRRLIEQTDNEPEQEQEREEEENA